MEGTLPLLSEPEPHLRWRDPRRYDWTGRRRSRRWVGGTRHNTSRATKWNNNDEGAKQQAVGAASQLTLREGVMANYTLRWDQNLPANQRFVVLAAFNNEAVLDKNTGLVWEKSPQSTGAPWASACFDCLNKVVGRQRGWRLPSIVELTSLLDPSVGPVPTGGLILPAGHPFTNVHSAEYWSATTTAEDPTRAWFVYFEDGHTGSFPKDRTFWVWCVRGGMNTSVY